MFTFSKRSAGRFDVHASFQSQGDDHKKRFGAGVTPQNQKTINIYARGEFRFEIGSFSQIMPQGSTTLGLELEEFPSGEISTETVLSAYGLRYCVAPSLGGSFAREEITLVSAAPISFPVDTLAFVLDGSIEVAGVTVGQAGYVLIPARTEASGDARILALS